VRSWTTTIASGLGAAAFAVTVTAASFGAAAPASAAAPAQSSGKQKVTVGDNFFKPEDVEITAGTKITWVNKGKILHTVTPDKGKAYGKKALGKGKKYSYTFKKPGEYAYHCALHGAPGSGQHGTIVVKAAAAPTTTTSATSAP
jgi:plastocyanin